MDRVGLNDPNAVEKAVNTLDEGGIVMHPTETCYGFAVDIFNEDALKKLYYVKDMKSDKPISMMVDSIEMAREYGEFSDKALEFAKKYWPGPLSILVPRKATLPEFFNKGHEFVSIRLSDLEFCQNMIMKFGQPVTTTSANAAGESELYIPEVLPGIDCIIDGGKLVDNKPSTLVKIDGDKVEVLREGGLVI
ncbi:MAG: L-threonylcarbamoyladenylate synthase [bacterium]|nr:L-threonylcarbamoyladenylate synthase [bacterium]